MTRRSQYPGWWLALVLVVAAALRWLNLGTREVWLDEASTFHIVSSGDFLHQLTIAHTPPLYYILLRGWTRLAGFGELALRLPSAVFGIVTVAAIYWAGVQIFERRRAALCAAALAALSPLHLYYSQEARAYSLALLALVLAYATLWRALRRDDTRSWLAFAVACAATGLSHYLFLIALLPTVFALRLFAARAWHYAAAALLAVVALLPWVVWSFWLNQHPPGGTSWIGDIFAATPPLLALPVSFEVLTIGSHAGFLPVRLKAFHGQLSPLLRAVAVAAALLFAAAAVGRRQATGRVLAACAFGALAVLWTVSLVRPVYVVARYDMIAFPALVLLLGYGLDRLLDSARVAVRTGAAALLALYGTAVAAQLWEYHSSASTGENREVAALLERVTAAGDVVVFTSLGGLPVLYELSKLGFQWRDGSCVAAARRFACVMYPRETEGTPASMDSASVDYSRRAVADEVDDILAARRSSGALVRILFGGHASKRDALAVSRIDAALVRELERRGLQVTAVEPALGLMTFGDG